MTLFKSILSSLCFAIIVRAQNTTTCGTAGDWLRLTSQAQATALAGCSQVLGSLQIGAGVTSLSSLSTLQSVALSLQITQTDFSDLTGLENLKSIGENLFINSNSRLTSLKGLEGLTNVTGGILVYDSPILTSISALSNLKDINPSQSPRYQFGVSIYRNPLLKSLDGLQGLNSVGNLIFIENCPLITTLSPLGAPGLVPGHGLIPAPANVSVNAMAGLTDLKALRGFTTRASATTGLHIQAIGKLTTLEGLETFTNIGNLTISSNPDLVDVKVLGNATISGPFVVIEDNGKLCDLSNLNVTIPAKVPSAKILYACGTGTGSPLKPDPNNISKLPPSSGFMVAPNLNSVFFLIAVFASIAFV